MRRGYNGEMEVKERGAGKKDIIWEEEEGKLRIKTEKRAEKEGLD